MDWSKESDMLSQDVVNKIIDTRRMLFWLTDTQVSRDDMIQLSAKQVISREINLEELQQVKDQMESSNLLGKILR